MKPAEHKVVSDLSDWYVYTPSSVARSTFLYVLRTGHYVYEPGYVRERAAFDSFLLMFVRSGSVSGSTAEKEKAFNAFEGQFVLIDCYERYSYSISERTEMMWLHFDGISAREYFKYIVNRLGTVFSIKDSTYVLNRMERIFDVLASGSRFSEVTMAQKVFDILTGLASFASEPKEKERSHHVIEDVVAYISQHLNEQLSVPDLAEHSYMSEYHFIRTFKRETGYTPHAYIMDSRMNVAKFLLANSDEPISAIVEECGFSSLSVFGAVFKKNTGYSASEYRERLKKSVEAE